MISLKFLLALSLFDIAIIHSANIYSGQGLSGQISIDAGEVICGGYTCPKTSTGCVFQQRNNRANPTMVDVMRRCLDETGGITDESNYQFEARNGERYNTYVNSGSNGNNVIVIDDELNADKQKEIERHVKQITEKVNREVSRDINSAMRGLQHDLENLGNTLKNIGK